MEKFILDLDLLNTIYTCKKKLKNQYIGNMRTYVKGKN